MKKLLLLLCLLLGALTGRAQPTSTGNYTDGTHYSFSLASSNLVVWYIKLFQNDESTLVQSWNAEFSISPPAARSTSGTFVVPNGVTYKFNFAYQQSGGSFFNNMYTVTGTASSTPPPGSNNRTINFSYYNAYAFPAWFGVQRASQPGLTFGNRYVEVGQYYRYSISVPAADTDTYTVVFVDADTAFDDGGGSIHYYPGANGEQNVYDFTGYTTAVGSTYTAAANGVSGGARVPGSISAPASGATPQDAPPTAIGNPRYISPGGLPSGATDDALAAVDNTNAITGAIADLQSSLGSIAVTVDMSATNAKLDTISGTLTTANTKTDSTNAKLDTTNGKLDSTNSKLDSANSKLTDVVGELETTKGLLGGKLDTANGHLSNIKDGVNALKGDLDDVQKFVTGTATGQTGYSNADKLALANSAASGVGSYGGVKPTVSGPLPTSIPGSDVDWGPGYTIGTTTFTFGFNHLSPTMDALFVAGRSLLLAAMCLGFLRGASRTVTTYTAALPQVVAQDTGAGPENLVPGVSQSKTYATAAASVAVIFTGAAALVAFVDTLVTYYGGGVANIFAAINFPAASAAGAVDRFVPLAAGLGLTVLGVAVPYLVAPLFLGTSAIIRFMKT